MEELVRVLAEVIGGTQRVLPVSGNPTMAGLAALIADADERSLESESGAPLRWILYVPNGQGGFAPADSNEDLDTLRHRFEQAADASLAGFAGPGELDGESYSFRVRLFIPPSQPPSVSLDAGPQPISDDEEIIDLTDIDAEADSLLDVRRVRKKRRKRKPGESGRSSGRRRGQGSSAEMKALDPARGESGGQGEPRMSLAKAESSESEEVRFESSSFEPSDAAEDPAVEMSLSVGEETLAGDGPLPASHGPSPRDAEQVLIGTDSLEHDDLEMSITHDERLIADDLDEEDETDEDNFETAPTALAVRVDDPTVDEVLRPLPDSSEEEADGASPLESTRFESRSITREEVRARIAEESIADANSPAGDGAYAPNLDQTVTIPAGGGHEVPPTRRMETISDQAGGSHEVPPTRRMETISDQDAAEPSDSSSSLTAPGPAPAPPSEADQAIRPKRKRKRKKKKHAAALAKRRKANQTLKLLVLGLGAVGLLLAYLLWSRGYFG